MNGTDTSYSIAEVAEQTGISRRTVRFYVQRELIDPPLGLGRGRHYTSRHIDQIRRIRNLQRQGISLDQIAVLSTGEPAEPEAETPAASFDQSMALRIQLTPGVVLELDAQRGTPSQETLNELARACAEILNRTGS